MTQPRKNCRFVTLGQGDLLKLAGFMLAKARLPRVFRLLAFFLLASGAYGQYQTVSIPVGSGPVALAVNQTTHLLYIANQTSNSVSVIDTNPANVGTFNTVVATVPVGTAPVAIAINEATNKIYVANNGSANVTVIDGTSNTAIATIVVNIINPSTNPPTTFVFHPDALAVNQNTNQIYVGNGDCAFAAIDGNTNAVRHPNYPDLCQDEAIVVNPASNMVYVASEGDADIEMFNEVSGSNNLLGNFNTTKPIALATVPTGTIGAPDTYIYATDLLGSVEVISEASKKEIATVKTPNSPYALAANPFTRKVYVLNGLSPNGLGVPAATVSVISGTTLTTNITVGSSTFTLPAPQKVLVDTVVNTIYVANDAASTVTVIDGNADAVSFTVSTDATPIALAQDTSSGDVYVANQSAGTVTVLALAPSATSVASITALAFGPQQVGTTSAAQFVPLINRGRSPLTVTSISTGVASDFSETDNCLVNSPIPIGGSCTIQVTFTPSTTGTRTGALTISDTDPSNPQTITLTGTGTAGTTTTAGLSVSPSALTFGSQMVGTAGGWLGVTVTNTAPPGGPALLFTANSTNIVSNDFNFDGGCTPNPPATTLQVSPGASCLIEVNFQPTGTTTGLRTDQLTITDFSSTGITGPGVTYAVPISGIAIPATGVRLLAPSMSFGSQLVGTSSPGQVETLTNLGLANLVVSSYAVTGDFSITADNCVGASVAPGTSCEFIVTFNPTRAGMRTGQILVYDNQNYSPQTLTLLGAGAPLGVTLAPSTISFGSQLEGSVSPSQSVTLTNTGTSSLTISGITVGGDTSFLETDNCQFPANPPVPPGGSCTITPFLTPGIFRSFADSTEIQIVDSDPSSPHFVVAVAPGGTSSLFTVSPAFLTGSNTASVSDTYFQPLISKVQAIGNGWSETDTCSPPAFTLTSCTVTVTGGAAGSGFGQITIDDVNHSTFSPEIVALAGPYDITNFINTPLNPSLPVNITPIDTTTGTTPVMLTFPPGSITKAGITSLTTQPIGPTPPSGFQLGGSYYYLSTTAQFTNVTICISSPAVTSTSHLFHFVGAFSTDITIMPVTPPQICGTTTSFSPFAILQPAGPPALIQSTTGLGSNSPNPSAAGQAVTFLSGVSGVAPTGVPAPTGSVTFLDNGAPLGPAMFLSLAPGAPNPTAAFTTSALAAGTHNITAQYSGDGNYAPSTSLPLTQTVNKTQANIGVGSNSPNPSAAGQAVTFLSGVSGVAPAGVPAPAGSVTFLDNGVTLASGVVLTPGVAGPTATFTTSTLAAGAHSITAVYSGDVNYDSATTAIPFTETVNKSPSTINLSNGNSPNPSVVGQAVTFYSAVIGSAPAGVPAPTGSITFLDNGVALGPAVMVFIPTPANPNPPSITVSTLAAGTHNITAQYSGDNNYNSSFSPIFIQTVNKISTTLTFSASQNTVALGQAVTFTATVVPGASSGLQNPPTPGGSALFIWDNNQSSGPVQSSPIAPTVFTFTINTFTAGTHLINVEYTGDNNYSSSSAPSIQVTVTNPTTQTSISAPSVTYGTQASVTVSVNSSGNSVAGNVTLSVDGGQPIPKALSGGSAIFSLGVLSAGNHALSAAFPAQNGFPGSSATGTLTVTQAPLTLTADNKSKVYGAAMPALTFTAAGFVNGDTTASLTTQPTLSTTATGASAVGSYPITISGAADANYAITYIQGTLTITPAPLTITANNKNKTYGQTVTFAGTEFTASGLVSPDNVASVTLTSAGAPASAAVAGSPYAITPSAAVGTGLGNYNINYVNGALAVSRASLTITATSLTKVLDAANPSPFPWTATGFVNGENASVLTANPTCTTAATATSPVGSYPITCSSSAAVNYTISYVAGTLKIQYASAAGHVIQPPINANGSSVFKQGRTIPAKFAVYDANGVSIGTPGVVSSFYLTGIVSGTSTTSVEDVVDTNNPDTAFRWDGQEWIFNITTGNLSAGSTYVYTITLNDGSTIVFQYGLR